MFDFFEKFTRPHLIDYTNELIRAYENTNDNYFKDSMDIVENMKGCYGYKDVNEKLINNLTIYESLIKYERLDVINELESLEDFYFDKK